jgi:hypothetical protein
MTESTILDCICVANRGLVLNNTCIQGFAFSNKRTSLSWAILLINDNCIDKMTDAPMVTIRQDAHSNSSLFQCIISLIDMFFYNRAHKIWLYEAAQNEQFPISQVHVYSNEWYNINWHNERLLSRGIFGLCELTYFRTITSRQGSLCAC